MSRHLSSETALPLPNKTKSVQLAKSSGFTVPSCHPGLGRVLVVEDEEDYLTLACSALSAAGFKAEGLSDPREVFDRFEVFNPDAVVLDRLLPGDSGEMIACRLRAYLGPHCPALLLWTGDSSRQTEAGLLTGIIDDMVVKGQQGLDVLVQRVIKLTGWAHAGSGVLLNRKDNTVLFRGERGQPLTDREVDFLYKLGFRSGAGVSRSQGRMLLLEPGASDSSRLLLNSVVSRFKRKLPPALRAALVTGRGKGWRFEL